MIGVVLGVVSLLTASLMGWLLLRGEAGAPAVVVRIELRPGLRYAGLAIAAWCLLVGAATGLAAVTPLGSRIGIDDPLSALTVGWVVLALGSIIWLATRYSAIRADPAGLFFPYARVPWTDVDRLSVTSGAVSLDCARRAWNTWTGRAAVSRLLWPGTDEEWAAVCRLLEHARGPATGGTAEPDS